MRKISEKPVNTNYTPVKQLIQSCFFSASPEALIAINDAGDKLLATYSKRLMDVMRKEDTVARLAGDEFTIITERIDSPEQAMGIAQKTLDTLVRPMMLNDHEIIVSASIGISMSENDKEISAVELLKQAGLAMYQAKERGRNQCCLYSENLKEETTERYLIQREIQFALERGELSLAFQTQRNVLSNDILGHEALMRWKNPSIGEIPPDRFIPVVEDCGLIHEFTHWLLTKSLDWQSQRLRNGKPKELISLNLSAKNLHEHNFISFYKKSLEQYPVSPESLVFEITETAAMSNPESRCTLLKALRDTGANCAMG